MALNKKHTPTLYCGFCGKSQHEVAKLIVGPTVHICNECTELCAELCRELLRPMLPGDIGVKEVFISVEEPYP